MYRHLAPGGGVSLPRCYGAFRAGEGTLCLVTDRVDGYRLSRTPRASGLVHTCRDLAEFHSLGARRLPMPHNIFDRVFFGRVAGRLVSTSFADPILRRVTSRFAESIGTVIDVLAAATMTTVHGELYPNNVIVTETGVFVIDWESAGIGPGVLDFAVLTQGRWDPDLLAACEAEYWTLLAPDDLDLARKSLAAARLFAGGMLLLHLRNSKSEESQEHLAAEQMEVQLAALGG